MFETIGAWFAAAAEAEGYLALLRFTGLPQLARWLIRRKAGTVMMRDFAFFPNRDQLQRDSSSLEHSFAGAKHVDAMWVVGAEYAASQNMQMVKRILLPDPTDATLLDYAKSIPEGGSTVSRIQTTIDRAAKYPDTEVRYCDHFTGFSINLVDTNQSNGWVLVECVLPYSHAKRRPTIKIYKSRCSDAVDDFRRIFNRLWDSGKPANPAVTTDNPFD